MNFLRKINFSSNSLLPLASKFLNINPRIERSITNQLVSSFSIYARTNYDKTFLRPSSFLQIPSCGLKIKGVMRLRCKDCYYVRREGRLYVMCKSFPRHKQTQVVAKEKNTWILSHACQSKYRPY